MRMGRLGLMGLAVWLAACETPPPEPSKPEEFRIGGTVEGLTGVLELRLDGGEKVSLSADGSFTFQAKRLKGATYAVEVATQPQGQRCTVSMASGTVAGNVEDISIRCHPWFVLDTFQAAGVVLGQGNFTSNTPDWGGTPAANTLNGPWGNPVFAGGRLYVSELGSNRILGFSGVPASNGAAADFVLGQADFAGTQPGGGQGGLANPEGLSSDGTRLAVADMGNSRVLLHSTLPTSTGANPSVVLGQPSFDAPAEARCNAQSVSFPEDVFIGHGKVLVADSGNHRVLVWNSLPTSNGASADLVLGQVSLNGCAPNDAGGDGVQDDAPSASTLWTPSGVWTDGSRLVVADTGNHRVLVWNSFPTRNGQPADVVLGQPDFTSGAAATTATGMKAPYLVASTGLQLFVVEYQNHRVLMWNQFPTTPGAPADVVLGQPDFTTASPVDPPSGSTPSARSLFQPGGILLVWPHVVVTDYGNNRLLVFESR